MKTHHKDIHVWLVVKNINACDKKDPSENAQHIKRDHARAQEYLVTANALEVF